MLFNSYVFVFNFLPVLLGVYYLLGHMGLHRWQKIVLIAASLYFYGYFNPEYLIIMCASIVFNYSVSKFLLRTSPEKKKLKLAAVFLGVAANLSVLFYFKYFDFFLENINAAFHTDYNLRHIVLPLGISFFTFQQISYVIDSYRMETDGYTFEDYALFVSFFPQLVAGPIVLHNEIIPQFQKKENLHINFDSFAHGIFLFAIGLFKKVLVADTLGKAVTWGFGSHDTLSSLETVLVVLSYTFQIYFDFSGYCDMANGLARMFNIVLPMNFNSPYKATDIIDFWSRWHMTLTRFLRQYVYFPLGGSRKGTVRTYINIIIVFLCSGLWHGANWTFILWGALHGIANVLTRMFNRTWKKMHTAFQWLLTFILINLGWLLFRADSLQQAWEMLRKIIKMDSFMVRAKLSEQFEWLEYQYLLSKLPLIERLNTGIFGFAMWTMLACCLFVCVNCKNSHEIAFRATMKNAIITACLLVWAIMSLGGVSTFLYFNF